MTRQHDNSEPVVLTVDELKQLSEHVVIRTLSTLGIDMTQPVEVQKDFHFLRSMRKSSESVWGKILCVFITVSVGGALAALWLGIKHLVQ